MANLTIELPILERFSEADTELLATRALLRRVDSKFLVGTGALSAILADITDDYAILSAAGKRLATYRTLYYDTPDLACYHDHRRGRRPRQKVRIRHYDDRAISYLEIKTKRSELISAKTRTRLAFGDSVLSELGRQFVSLNSRLPGAALTPAAHTDFHRVTLLGLRTRERLTLDLNLVVATTNNGETPIALDGIVIVEVKQAHFSRRTPIMISLQSRGYRPASASKYCTATALLRPELRNNRLLPALRAIERLRQ